MANKAVLLNIGVFLADNNVRRNIASFLVNAQSAEAEVNQRDTNVLPEGTYTYESVPDNSLTVIKTSRPLTAEVNQGSTSFEIVINSVMILNDAIEGIVFTNEDEDNPAQLSIIQI